LPIRRAHRSLRYVVAALALTGLVASAMAAEPGCSRPITVAAAPLGRSIMITPEGEVTGAQYDLLKRAGLDGNCVFDPVVLPWARALAMLQDGAIDLLPGAVWSAERDAIADFVVVDRVWPMLISLRERPLGVDGRAALVAAKARLGVVRGFDYGADYRALLTELQQQDRLDRAADADTLARELAILPRSWGWAQGWSWSGSRGSSRCAPASTSPMPGSTPWIARTSPMPSARPSTRRAAISACCGITIRNGR